MESIFETQHFLIRKWLLSFVEGEARLLPVSKLPYKNVKATCTQMKRMGKGEWKVTKKGYDGYTRVTRIK